MLSSTSSGLHQEPGEIVDEPSFPVCSTTRSGRSAAFPLESTVASTVICDRFHCILRLDRTGIAWFRRAATTFFAGKPLRTTDRYRDRIAELIEAIIAKAAARRATCGQ